MSNFDPETVLAATHAKLQACRAQLHQCERAWANSDFRDRPEEELLSEEQGVLAYRLRDAHLNVLLLLEAVGSDALLEEHRRVFEPMREQLNKTEHHDQDPELMYSEPLIWLSQVVDAVEPHVSSEPRKLSMGRAELVRILRETGVYLKRLDITPTSEAEVCRPTRALLRSVFPDTVSEFSLPQPHKTYRLDMGVQSLRTGVEFKFAASEQELKVELDGIFADMRGYKGSRDWERFIAVFYTAGPVESQRRIEETFRIVEADFEWRPLVVVGEGRRKVRARQGEKRTGTRKPGSAKGPKAAPKPRVTRSTKP